MQCDVSSHLKPLSGSVTDDIIKTKIIEKADLLRAKARLRDSRGSDGVAESRYQMKHRCIVMVCMIVTAVMAMCASVTVGADSTLQNLAQCRRVYAYSGNNNAYFYGFGNHTLCSARAIPDETERTVTTDGVIRAVCHDEAYAYALITTANSQYSLIKLDMNSGEYQINPLASGNNIQHNSFAVSDGEIFLIVHDSTYGHVESRDFDGNPLHTYYLDKGVNYLFHNGGNAYAVSFSGEIYCLSFGKISSCAKIESYSECQNAGVGYIQTDKGQLVSLTDGTTRNGIGTHVVISDGELFSFDSGLLLAAANHSKAILKDNYQSVVSSRDTPDKPIERNSSNINRENTLIVDAGMTVAALKKRDESISAVYDNDGQEIGSGKLRTGYSLKKHGIEYPLVVRGDLNASGTVNSRDIKLFMEHLVGNSTLTGVFAIAADWNGDGNLDNRDLVLLSKKVTIQ